MSTQALAPCGTRSAYNRHRRRNEPIDDACNRANNTEHQITMSDPRQQARSRAWSRALRLLAHAHPEETQKLLEASLATLEPGTRITKKIRSRHRQRAYRRLKDRRPEEFDRLFQADLQSRLDTDEEIAP